MNSKDFERFQVLSDKLVRLYYTDETCGKIINKNIINKPEKYELNSIPLEASIELILRIPCDDEVIHTLNFDIEEIFDNNTLWDFQQNIIKKAIQKTKEEIKKIL